MILPNHNLYSSPNAYGWTSGGLGLVSSELFWLGRKLHVGIFGLVDIVA
jgi:hypothetical protein